jgi:hypothetical protein
MENVFCIFGSPGTNMSPGGSGHSININQKKRRRRRKKGVGENKEV